MRSLVTKSILFLAVAAGATAELRAQYNWDVGLHLGGANYLGEMGGKEQTRRDFIWDMKLSQTRWAVGPFARYKINRQLSVNTGLLYMRIQGADALSTNPQRVGRNLNFRNDMFELYLRPEFTIFQDNDIGGRGRYRTDFRLFVYAGAAVYYHNPKGQINRVGDFYDLRPLTTELVEYSQWGFAVPAGMGFHITKKRRHRFGFDFGWRTTFTDYLDDVSTEYQDPALMPDGVGGLADQLADQSLYVLDLDLNTPGVQQNPDLPSHYQYGWEPNDSDGKLNKRGDPSHNDSYLTMTFTYSYVLRGQSNFYRQRYSWVRGKKRIGRKSRAKF
ncbi:MAG: outer membrane beta-barrel protein [Flavobacteriales bacterium]|nr:outer membrane beta-barrel protein [Flavobacteriales bacterium]